VWFGVGFLVLVVGAIVGALLLRPHGPREFEAADATFTVPAEWHHTSGTKGLIIGSGERPHAIWQENFLLDEENIVTVLKRRLPASISPETFHAHFDEVAGEMRAGIENSGGRVLSGPRETELDAMPAARMLFEGHESNPVGAIWTALFVFAADDDVAYTVRCQFDNVREDEVRKMCERLLDSFRRT